MSDPRFIQEGFEKCLAHVVEECGEVLAAAGKTQRWGRWSVNPLLPDDARVSNEDWLSGELADLKDAIGRLEETMDVPKTGDYQLVKAAAVSEMIAQTSALLEQFAGLVESLGIVLPQKFTDDLNALKVSQTGG